MNQKKRTLILPDNTLWPVAVTDTAHITRYIALRALGFNHITAFKLIYKGF